MSLEFRKLVILVVDDEERNRKLLGDLVNFMGHDVVFASNGQEALEKLLIEKIDLMLLDLMMPIVDGIQVMKILRRKKTFSNLGVIIVSAITELETKNLALSNGASGFLHKPIERQELISMINSVAEHKLNIFNKARVGN